MSTKIRILWGFDTYSKCIFLGEFDQLILNLIVNATLPFSLVEQNDFKLLCQKGFPSRTLLSRPTLMCRLNAAFDYM